MENMPLINVTEIGQGRKYERGPNRERSREYGRCAETASYS